MQFAVQPIQQAYLGTRERAVVVLKDGTPRARAEFFGGSAGLWIHEASKSIRLQRRCRTRRVSTTFSASGRSFPTPAKSSSSITPWYGRVLVERVEGIASEREWQRGYEEINQFERMLVADGVRIVKCFCTHSSEQIRRLKDRLTNPLKRWKLSYEDLRNQSRWTDLRSRSKT